MASGNSDLEIIINGAGLEGLCAGISLRQREVKVVILEMKQAAGQVVSRRGPHMANGTGHSTYLFLGKGDVRTQYSFAMNAALHDPRCLSHRAALNVYRELGIPTGKNVAAWTEDGCKMITRLMELSQGTPVEQISRAKAYFGSDVAQLQNQEPFFANRLPKGVLRLPKVSIYPLPKIIEQLQEEFERLGGKILFNHEVVGFDIGTDRSVGTKGTGVVCKVDGEETTLRAHAAINLTGMYGAHSAELSGRPLMHLNGSGSIIHPFVPNDPHYHHYGVFAPQPGTLEEKERIQAPLYCADYLELGDGRLGQHLYAAIKQSDGYSYAAGTLRYVKNTLQELAAANENDMREAPPGSYEELEGLVRREVDRNHVKIMEAGRVAVFYHDGKRDFYPSIAAVPGANYFVVNSITGDTPGASSAPLIGEVVAEAIIALVSGRPTEALHYLRNPMLALAA